MKLYYAPGACSLAVHIALREADVEFELVRVDLAKREVEGGADFAEINPRGYVPVLEIQRVRHTEAVALLQHVADMAPRSGLLAPVGTPQRLTATQWLVFVATELHKTLGALWHAGLPDAARAATRALVLRRLGEVELGLAAHDHLAGPRFGVADAYAFAVIGWTRPLGLPLDAFPRLQAWLARVAERPAVRAALAAEGLATA